VHGVRRVDRLATAPVIHTDANGDLSLDAALSEHARAGDPALAQVPAARARSRRAVWYRATAA
jgi:hypothetical protein